MGRSRVLLRTVQGSALALVLVLVWSVGATRAHAAPLVTLSGRVTLASSGAPATTAGISISDCAVGGVTGGGNATFDDTGHYELQVPAGCTGRLEFSATVPGYFDVPRAVFHMEKTGVAMPTQDTTLDLVVPDEDVVILSVNATYSDGTPVTHGDFKINDSTANWPTDTVPLFGQLTGTGAWHDPYPTDCFYDTARDCQFIAHRNTTVSVLAETNLPGGITSRHTDNIPIGNTNTTATIRLDDKPTPLVTLSGRVTLASSGAPATTAGISISDCAVGGVTGGGNATFDDTGHYELQVPAGCTGRLEFSATVPGYFDVPRAVFHMEKTGVAMPTQDTTLDLVVPDEDVVILSVNATYSDGTPVTHGDFKINDSTANWPTDTVPLFGQLTGTGAWHDPYPTDCFYDTARDCQFIAHRNTTVSVLAETNLPGGITSRHTDNIPIGNTNTAQTFVLRNLAEVGSSGANAGAIGIVAPAGTTVSKATTSSTDANPLTDGMSDLTGAVDYTVSGLTPGGSIRMTFGLPDGATPTNVYKLIGDTYVDVTGAATFSGQLVTLKITDGALGDTDGEVNGVIVDPVVVVHSRLKAQNTLSVRSLANTPFNVAARLSTSGGSGTGRVSYVAMNGTSAGCTVVDGVLTALKAGTCKVVASKAGDGRYRLATSAARTVTFTAGRLDAPNPTLSPAQPVVDADLTATAGSWGPEPVSLGYQWYQKSKSGKVTKITGATSSTYHVKASDLGYRIRAKVTGTKTGYTTTTKYTAYTPEVGRASFTTTPTPLIGGVARAQMTLTVTTTEWEPTPTSVKIRWQRNVSGAWNDITGATATSYHPTTTDIGRALRAKVSASRTGYITTTGYSEPTLPVTPGITPDTPSLTELSPTVDQELGVTPGTWSPGPEQFTYQWYAKSASGKITQIPDATTQTYLVEGRWAGYRLRARVTSHLTDYADTSRYTAWSAPTAKATFTNTPAPVIDGTPQIGQQLTAQPGDWQPTPAKLSYTWYRGSNTTWTAITNTTTPTYTLTAADLGKQIRVRMTAERTGYTTVTTYSQPVTPTT